MPTINTGLRKEVISIYKGNSLASTDTHMIELLNLGKDYPQGFDYFRPRLHKAFMANAHLKDEDEIRRGLARADFVKKEIEAL
ncbi:hypothetical protein GE09DRAFT_152901 [Coniochaeta sp. 2T2.1]|nr:hypothetical protein GE09DRAFT_152901 [Coniochaeta sp. 2T2.1]